MLIKLYILNRLKGGNWVVQCGNVSSGICRQRMPRSACAFAQSDQGLRSPLTESLDTIECISGEQMPGSDFAHAWNESESEHFAHARRHISAWRGPITSFETKPTYNKSRNRKETNHKKKGSVHVIGKQQMPR